MIHAAFEVRGRAVLFADAIRGFPINTARAGASRAQI